MQVDVFDRLPTPWGLVRAGVAPDHPNIKAVSRVYEKTAAHPEFRFFGHVEFGADVTHADLAERYHAIVYAVGAQTDRRMGIPGEDLPGSVPATEFVAWYNGHPDFCEHDFDLSHERAVVIGNGNVAVDVARMLALTREELAETDVADHAIDALADSGIREIVVLGRRGPAQAAFTNPELLELGRDDRRGRVRDRGGRGARPAQRGLPRERRGARDLEEERRHPARLLRPRGGGQAPPDRAALPRLAGRDRRRRQGRGDPHLPQRARRGRGRRASARRRPSRSRSWSAGSCSARSATRARRSRACRSTSAAARSPTIRDACSARTASRSRASTPSAGSSAGPSGIIGTNKRDAQETVDRLLEDLDAGVLADPSAAAARRARAAARRAQARPRHLHRLGGDRRGREGGRRAARPPARQAHHLRAAARGRAGRGRRPAANASASPRERAQPRRRARPAPARPRRRCR